VICFIFYYFEGWQYTKWRVIHSPVFSWTKVFPARIWASLPRGKLIESSARKELP